MWREIKGGWIRVTTLRGPHSALRMRVFASAPARTVAGEEEVCRVHVEERGRKREKEIGRRPERKREREAATIKSSSCQPGRAFTVWSYPGERETRCDCEGGRGMQRSV